MYIILMKDDDEIMFKKRILHENIIYEMKLTKLCFRSYASYIPIYFYTILI